MGVMSQQLSTEHASTLITKLQPPPRGETATKQPSASSSDGGWLEQRRGSLDYATCMEMIYKAANKVSQLNYRGAHLQLPSNLQFKEWEELAHTDEDGYLIEYPMYGFPVEYDGPVPTPMENNHLCPAAPT